MKKEYAGRFLLLPKQKIDQIGSTESVSVAKKHVQSGGKVKIIIGELEHIFDTENDFEVFCNILSN